MCFKKKDNDSLKQNYNEIYGFITYKLNIYGNNSTKDGRRKYII